MRRRAYRRGGGGAGVPVADFVRFRLVRGKPGAAGVGVAGVRGTSSAGVLTRENRERVRGTVRTGKMELAGHGVIGRFALCEGHSARQEPRAPRLPDLQSPVSSL